MAATLRKWLHMSAAGQKRNGAGMAEIPNGDVGSGSPSRRQQLQNQPPNRRARRRLLGGAAADAARRLLARARNAVSRVSPAAENNINGQQQQLLHNVVLPINVTLSHAGRRTSSSLTTSTSVEARSAAHGKIVRTRRLMREFQEISTRPNFAGGGPPVFTVELVDDNLYEWYVKLHRIDPDSELSRDLRETGTPFVLLSLSFPENFPFAPPFMRVVSPRIEKGFVMEGGAICMELLTPAGWASAYTVEAIVMQFAASVVKGQGRIVRKVKVKGGGGRAGGAAAAAGSAKANAGGGSGGSAGKTFSRKSAEASFRSLVKTHDKYGWVTPPLADG